MIRETIMYVEFINDVSLDSFFMYYKQMEKKSVILYTLCLLSIIVLYWYYNTDVSNTSSIRFWDTPAHTSHKAVFKVC